MIAADKPVQRSANSKLLHVDAAGGIRSVPRTALIELLRPGDVVIANDAATLPASLHGVHLQTGDADLDRLLPFETSRIAFQPRPSRPCAARVSRTAASSRSARRWSARSSMRRRASVVSLLAMASRTSASVRRRACASSMRFSPALTSRARATTICCTRSRARPSCAARIARSTRKVSAPTSSAIPF